MKLILNGATGKMGRAIEALVSERDDFTIVAKVTPDYPEVDPPCYPALTDYDGPADCIVDFSNHACTLALTAYAVKRSLPLVIATTGHTEEELDAIQNASESVPVFFSANMSLGIAVLAKLAKEAAAMFPSADIEIIEIHHNQKIDAPSGTALMLGRAIQEVRPGANLILGRSGFGKREKADIGISSIRLGNEVGTHEILISTGAQTLTLKHEAESRVLFAEGGLAAAQFIVQCEPGLYNMNHLVNKEN